VRISTAQMFQQQVTAMLEQQVALARTEQQLATGKRLVSAADDPAASLRSLQLGDRLTQNEQYLKNLDTAQSRLELEEGALASSIDVLQRVRELAVQALSATLGPGDLKSIEVEVRSRLEDLLSIANTQNANGEFLFAGYQVDTIPFSSDGSGNFTYNGDQGQQHLQVSQTRQLAAADNGADVFLGVTAAAGGITSNFDILNNFADALAAGTVSADTLTDIDTAMDKILVVRADVGSRLRAVDDQRSTNESFDLVLQKERADLVNLDYTEAISRFNQQLLALQASEQVFAKVQGLSLFDYLG
jgi:flagellar hook-associated protein 3 FlgL